MRLNHNAGFFQPIAKVDITHDWRRIPAEHERSTSDLTWEAIERCSQRTELTSMCSPCCFIQGNRTVPRKPCSSALVVIVSQQQPDCIHLRRRDVSIACIGSGKARNGLKSVKGNQYASRSPLLTNRNIMQTIQEPHIELSKTENELVQYLKQVREHLRKSRPDLPSCECRIAGGWVRDKVCSL